MNQDQSNGHNTEDIPATTEIAEESRELIPQPTPETSSIYARAEVSERMLFKPPIDIYETEEGLVLLADLPGVAAETLELQVQDNKLTLYGRVKSPVGDDVQLRHGEYHEGDFLRSFILSHEVDYDRIKATMNNGVLKVVLPKAQKAEPRRIQVQTD